jgi:hypothetical protein
MRVAELCRGLVELEEQADFWRLHFGEVPLWHALRYRVFDALLAARGASGKRQSNWRDRAPRDLVAAALELGREGVRRAAWTDLGPGRLLVVPHPRYERFDDGWACPFTWPLLRGSAHDPIYLEEPLRGVHRKNTASDRIVYPEVMAALGGLRALARPDRAWPRRAQRRALEEAIDEIDERFNVALNRAKIRAAALRFVAKSRALTPGLERLLEHVRPEVLIEVVHYSDLSLVLNPLARARGIEIVELQHGTLGPIHLAYNVKDPSRSPAFPDWLLSFGPWWSDVTPDLAAHHTRAVGWAYLEQRLQARTSTSSGALLFLSQGPVGPELTRMAVDVAARAKGVRVRLHPGEREGWSARYPWLAAAEREGTLEVSPEHRSLDEDLADADAVAGVFSTALYEAIAFEKTVLVLALDGHEQLMPLIDEGGAVLCADADQVVAARDAAARYPRTRLFADEPRARFERFLSDRLA